MRTFPNLRLNKEMVKRVRFSTKNWPYLEQLKDKAKVAIDH